MVRTASGVGPTYAVTVANTLDVTLTTQSVLMATFLWNASLAKDYCGEITLRFAECFIYATC